MTVVEPPHPNAFRVHSKHASSVQMGNAAIKLGEVGLLSLEE